MFSASICAHSLDCFLGFAQPVTGSGALQGLGFRSQFSSDTYNGWVGVVGKCVQLQDQEVQRFFWALVSWSAFYRSLIRMSACGIRCYFKVFFVGWIWFLSSL